MAFSNNDPIYACFRCVNSLPVGQTDTGERVYRDVIGTGGEWNINDTIKINDATYLFFGYEDASSLTDEVIVQDSNGNLIASSTSGQGTTTITVTLDAAGPAGDTLSVCYRTGISGTYDFMCHDKGDVKLDCHDINLDTTPTYQQVFNVPHPIAGASATLKASVMVDGLSIQSDPPA